MEQIHVEVGGRPVLNNDLLLLQTELAAIAKAIILNRNAFILNGCVVSGSGPYNISSGQLIIDNEVMNFDAVSGVTMPYYIKQDTPTLNTYKPYEVGGSKATRKLIKAVGTNVLPVSGEYVTMSAAGGRKTANAFDSEFVLTAGTQNVAGNKTFSGNNTYSGASTFSGTANFTNTTSLNGTINTNITSTGVVQGTRFTSTVASGTAPLTVTSNTVVSNLNADLLDGQHAAYFEGRDNTVQANVDALSAVVAGKSYVLSGFILMWSGSVGSIPASYFLCDGNNGTPDLRNRFILGAGSTYSVGATGGATTHTLTTSEMPSHTHTVFSAGSHNHYVSEVDRGEEGNDGTDQSVGSYSESGTAKYTSYAGDHTHSLSYAGSGAAHNNMPPYYALCYIMKA